MTEETMIIEDKHSVEFSINAKGQWSGKVKCYGTTPDEAYERAMTLATKVNEETKKKNGDI